MKNNLQNHNFLLYKTPDWEIKVDVLLQDENIWMSQKSIAELFWVDRTVITKHLKNIFETWELDEKWTSAKNALVQKEWNREIAREISFYNLDVIIATWYRVNSMQAKEQKIMTIDDWIKKIDWFLQFHEKNILTNAWKISKELAFKKAHKEFWIYNIKRLDNYISDFDLEIKTIENMRLSKNIWYSSVDDKEWVETFNKISGENQKKIILW